MTSMNYLGLDVHKKTISYCVKGASGQVQQEGKAGSTRRELDCWMKTLPQPWTVAMEATIFSGWICDHLLPHVTQIKVAHPLMLRAIAAAKKKNDQIDADSRLAKVRFSAGEPHDASGDPRPPPHLTLQASAGEADGADE
jgi:transposase